MSLHSESIARNLFQYNRPLTKLLWDQRANSLWRLIVRKRSQIASFGLLHYLLLLPKTVLLTTPVHKSNLKHTSNKCSSEEEKVLRCTPLTPRRRGGDKELGEDQKINREAIWHRSTLETPTTVDSSAVFPLVCVAWGTAAQVTTTTEGSIAVWTEAACTNQYSPPEKYTCTQGSTSYSYAYCILSREAYILSVQTLCYNFNHCSLSVSLCDKIYIQHYSIFLKEYHMLFYI